MPGNSPFADDWRECLGAHYQYTVRNQDAVTERTLVGVMRSVGFSDQQLAELKVLATMHSDDLPPDFVPDMELLTALAQRENDPPSENFQIAVPNLPEEAILSDDDMLQGDLPEDEAEVEPEPPPKADGPAQLSMF